MRNPSRQLILALSLVPKARVWAYVPPVSVGTTSSSTSFRRYRHDDPNHKQALRPSVVHSLSSSSEPTTTTTTTTIPKTSQIQANRALLLSSFTDGIQKSPEAQDFLRSSLLLCMLQQRSKELETKIEQSVLTSPCNGPDPDALKAMEDTDQLIRNLRAGNATSNTTTTTTTSTSTSTPTMKEVVLDAVVRFVYIPTALYALRGDSTSTPGKQRQRARADGKERRNQIVQTLYSIFQDKNHPHDSDSDIMTAVNVAVHAVTLDLDDGSIKHQEGSENNGDFPKTGKDALQTWNPHLIYVEGGNTFWLYHCMEKGGWRPDLLNLICNQETSSTIAAATAVYCGKSAGAILAGERIDTATWKGWDDPTVVPGREKYEAWGDVSGLNILGGISIFPHMTEQWDSLVAEKSVGYTGNVCCISDHEICLVDGEQQTLSIVRSVS